MAYPRDHPDGQPDGCRHPSSSFVPRFDVNGLKHDIRLYGLPSTQVDQNCTGETIIPLRSVRTAQLAAIAHHNIFGSSLYDEHIQRHPMLFRLSALNGADWVRVQHPDTFAIEVLDGGLRRLRCTTQGDTATFFRLLTTSFASPYFLLYVLHTPRGDAEPGRYQSGALTPEELKTFVAVFADFLSGDGRHDLWASAPNDGAQVVWDRHDVFFVYGRLEAAEALLRSHGFREGTAKVLDPHAHHYHAEFDDAEHRLISYYDWLKTPLQSSDVQIPTDEP